MADDELTPERSSQSVNRCIVRMAAAGRRERNDSAGAWGEVRKESGLTRDHDEGRGFLAFEDLLFALIEFDRSRNCSSVAQTQSASLNGRESLKRLQ